MPLSASALSRLEFQHQTIRELIRNTTEPDLRRRIQPDKWSAFENIAHLTAYQPIFIRRLKKMQEEADPEFSRYIADQDPNFPAILKKSVDKLLTDIDQQRTTIFTTLAAMDDTTLARNGIHPKYGRFSIKEWTEFFLLHEAHHMYAIFMLVQDLH
ncbi:MAG TPA: DinB family protein [Puia sp.]|jgi:uncharacterized damage-inducible protein DinB